MADQPAPTARFAGRLLLVVLGAWLAFSISMAVVATANFHELEPTTLRNAEQVFGTIPDDGSRRMALRYVASEMNRHFFVRHGALDLGLALLATALLLAAGGRPRWLLAVLLLCVAMAAFDAAWLTPALVERGRQIDFLPRDPNPPEVTAFYQLHAVDIVMELAKMALLAIGALALAWKSSTQARQA